MSDINNSLDEFQELLEQHDWYYTHSDDHSVWKRGEEMGRHIRRLADSSSEHLELYNKYLRSEV